MQLRRGTTKTILESSIECALLAVEIYNKPKANFRVESFITHMIMAWTKLFHAYFHHTIGERFYYKEKNKYKIIDGEKKAWELTTCITKYNKLSEPVKANLDFFIKLRNKIEHRHINREDIGVVIFGECQSNLYNYESTLITLFGNEYALNESLAFALQFSHIRTSKQILASKTLLSKEVREIKEFIEKYRESIADDTFSSQEYSIKLIQVPKISNTNKNDLAIQFVNWNSIEDKDNYEKIAVIIKDKVIKKETINPGKIKPGDVIKKVNQKIPLKINPYDHKCLVYIFSIRPTKNDGYVDPFETNTKYCHYDEAHKDYVYQETWVNFIVASVTSSQLNRNIWKNCYDNKKKLNISEYEIE